METGITLVLGFFGFIVTIALTVGVIILLRKPLATFLSRLINDETVIKYAVLFISILIGLVGLRAAFEAFFPGQGTVVLGDNVQFGSIMRFIVDGLVNLLNGYVDIIQWAVYPIALLFIGFSLRGWKGPKEPKE